MKLRTSVASIFVIQRRCPFYLRSIAKTASPCKRLNITKQNKLCFNTIASIIASIWTTVWWKSIDQNRLVGVIFLASEMYVGKPSVKSVKEVGLFPMKPVQAMFFFVCIWSSFHQNLSALYQNLSKIHLSHILKIHYRTIHNLRVFLPIQHCDDKSACSDVMVKI